MICGLPLQLTKSCDLIEKVLFVAEKYEMPGPVSIVRLFATTPLLVEQPLRLYSFACRYGWEEEVKVASNRTLKIDLFDPAYQDTLKQLPSKALLELLNLRHRRKEQYVLPLHVPPPTVIDRRP